MGTTRKQVRPGAIASEPRTQKVSPCEGSSRTVAREETKRRGERGATEPDRDEDLERRKDDGDKDSFLSRKKRSSEMEEDEDTCPLCLEQLDITDKHIDFCQCGYRMCLWCWNRIMEDAAKHCKPGRCPNCRGEYDEERIKSGRVDPTQLAKEQEKKRRKDAKIKYRPADGMSRKHLQNVRVIQRNLVYAIGIPLKHCREDTLKKAEFFGKYGNILKISVNRQGPTG